MTRKLKHSRSIGEKLRDKCSSAMHSLKVISNAVLQHNDDLEEVEQLFDNDTEEEHLRGDYVSVLKSENKKISQGGDIPTQQRLSKDKVSTSSDATNTSPTPIPTVTGASETVSNGAELWEKQREEWLTPTYSIAEIDERKRLHSLAYLTSNPDENIYQNIYRNLVIHGKPLKCGLNMADGFKVIHQGWENTNMFERVARGGVL